MFLITGTRFNESNDIKIIIDPLSHENISKHCRYGVPVYLIVTNKFNYLCNQFQVSSLHIDFYFSSLDHHDRVSHSAQVPSRSVIASFPGFCRGFLCEA